MRDLLYLGLLYIRHHKVKLLVLTFAITLVSWLPIGIQSIVDQTARQLLQRADSTPLVIGAPGSPLELSLGSLYFRAKTPNTLSYAELQALEATGYAQAIPLYYRFRVQDYPIVGTSPDYLDYRDLRLASGRPAALLGEAVIGAKVAQAMGLGVGDYVISSPESVFDLAGVYPLKMPVVGVLALSFSPDDEAVFVDLKTSWVIQGLGHGHQELNRRESLGQILKREGDNIIANASVRQFNEITADNLERFHFHGDNADNPLSAIIPVPHDEKSSALLLGHYLEVRLLAPADTDPAMWQPTVEDVLQLQGAELVMLNGAAYSSWLDKVSLSASRQVLTSAAARAQWIKLDKQVTHSHGPGGEHAHGDYAFTLWMDPSLARVQAEAVAVALQLRWPQHLQSIAANLETLIVDLEALDEGYRQQAGRLAGRQLIYSHPVYQYFQRRYALPGQSLHWEPDAMPTPQQWRALEQMLGDAPLFIWEAEPDPAIRDRMAELGLAFVILDPAASRGEADCLSVQQANIARLASLPADGAQ